MPLFILAVIVFVIADVLIRFIIKKINEKKIKEEREQVLNESLQLDFSKEAVSLKRAEVPDAKARILGVDDEEVILDSFRKILVLDGYSIDTVGSGAEALNLIKSHHYDFVFTDLKMPEMDGVEVTKAVKSVRPDIDVVIITGYATVETAVECMKYGAMDYVQKPFTEDELLDFTKKLLIKRQDRIKKGLQPRVHITHHAEADKILSGEFAIPGGVFIHESHTWASLQQDGTVRTGIDDFAKKIIGKIDNIEFPNLGMIVKQGETLFGIKQDRRTVTLNAPVSGRISANNTDLIDDLESLNITTYEKNWICKIDADNLDSELHNLKIGKTAVSLYQNDIDYCTNLVKEISEGNNKLTINGMLSGLEDKYWYMIIKDLFHRP